MMPLSPLKTAGPVFEVKRIKNTTVVLFSPVCRGTCYIISEDDYGVAAERECTLLTVCLRRKLWQLLKT